MAGQAVSRVGAAVSAYAGTKAGQNVYEQTGDLTEAAWRGAISARRWFVWILGCIAWLVEVFITFCIFMNASVSRQDYEQFHNEYDKLSESGYLADMAMFKAWLIALPITFTLLMVIYKRNIDFGLHKRQAMYRYGKVFSPVVRWAPNFLLYAGLIIVPVTLQFVFI